MPAHVRKGDDVVITSGRFRGKTGKVVRVIPDRDRVVVQGPGIDGIVRNIRPTRVNPQGGRVEVDRSFHISNVSPAVDGKPTRVRFETRADGSKVRIAVRGGGVLSEVRSASAKSKSGAAAAPKEEG
ncbi:MAG: 50S ribosomal protein L24 [Planctomycetota bacterium]